MTAELITMNKDAVVMASDSAVTVGGKKTFNGVNKLFMISDEPPMGAMIFNNAQFENRPMEALIKEFSKNCDFSLNNCVDLIKDDFLKFIGNNTPYTDVGEKIEESLKPFKRYVKSKTENLTENEAVELFNYYNDDNLPLFVKKLPEFKAYDDRFGEMIPQSVSTKNHGFILKCLKNMFFNRLLSDNTGVVIAGFNASDMFPSYVKFNMCWNINGKVNIIDCEEEINFEGTCISSFAQNDVINTFIMGIDDNIKINIFHGMGYFVKRFGQELKKPIESSINIDSETLKKVNEVYDDYTINKIHDFEKYFDSIMQDILESILCYVSALPKEELAKMAESMINMTVIKRKIDSDLETVGGDVDVAIISKGDGFIWKKRNQYFDKNLNPQYRG